MNQYDSHEHGRRSVRLKGWDYRSPGYYFVTMCTFRRVCLFDDLDFREVAANALCRVPEQEHAGHVALDEWVVMPNHVHVIFVFVDYPAQADLPVATDDFRNALAGSLGVVVGRYKAAVTTRIKCAVVYRGETGGRKDGGEFVDPGPPVPPLRNAPLNFARDRTSLDIFWLRGSLAYLGNPPEPDDLAAEIVENLEAGLNSFREILAA